MHQRRAFSQRRSFLSTPSARRATYYQCQRGRGKGISIHALRGEGDRAVCDKLTQLADISIHALREEGDPQPLSRASIQRGISIHALREEGDSWQSGATSFPRYFYPRPP